MSVSMSQSAIAIDPAEGRAVLAPPRGWLVAAAIVLLVVLTATFWNFLSAQVRFAIRNPADWGHTLVIPGIAASFVWMRRKELLAEPFRPAWAGLPILIAGVALYILCTFGPSAFALHHNARGLSFGISLFGLVLLLFGWRAMRWLWFPIAYVVVFGQTVTDRILNVVTFKLQDILESDFFHEGRRFFAANTAGAEQNQRFVFKFLGKLFGRGLIVTEMPDVEMCGLFEGADVDFVLIAGVEQDDFFFLIKP